MRLKLKALALLTFCSALIASCGEQRTLVSTTIPADRIDCQEVVPAWERPVIPSEYEIDWSKVTTVAQARREHDAFVQRLRERERLTAGYVLYLENRVFVCASDAAWIRDFQKRLKAAQG